VLIVGFGRVGRLVGEMLTEHGQAFLAIDANPSTVAKGRSEGANVFYGDAGRTEMLERCGIDTARAVVVTMDAPLKVDEVVVATRSLRPDLILIARARDHKHAARLYALGVTDAVPETTEASLQLAENTLVDLGVPMGLVLASIHERRDAFRRIFQEAMPDSDAARSPRALRSTLRR
jgi:CPA2 family monovalent cation:H+ antiporter-2